MSILGISICILRLGVRANWSQTYYQNKNENHLIIRNKFLVNWILPKRKDSKVALWAVLNKVGFGDWLLLYMIARNIDRALFTTLADNIYPPGAGYYPNEDEEDQPSSVFTSDTGDYSEKHSHIIKNFSDRNHSWHLESLYLSLS